MIAERSYYVEFVNKLIRYLLCKYRMMLGAKGASAPFRVHDIVLELAQKRYIMYPKMARSAFAPDIIELVSTQLSSDFLNRSKELLGSAPEPAITQAVCDLIILRDVRKPPQILYHGTGQKSVESIDRQGLLPRGRLYVHLSGDIETAIKVGRRHGMPVVYEVLSGNMENDGYIYYRSVNGVWLTKSVPIKYLRKREDL